ncbi:MAG: twin transmembrane helix small protein [Xanthomonadales bacterium]|nr:twin transmembrane helix small protein [Xanthomonadales bacterium]
MWTKYVIVGLLLFIVFNLGMGMFYMLKDGSRSDRTFKALAMRITMSVVLFGLLILGMATGLIKPHQNPLGVKPPSEQSSGAP